MMDLWNMLWIESAKAWRSRMPLYTALGTLLIPLFDAFFMIILKDPDLARQAGLISAKAQFMAGTADWPTFLNVLAQAVAVGGIFLFSLITGWVFGREFADGTVKDLLAVPVARTTILFAKFIVATVWVLGLALLLYGVSLPLGGSIGLAGASSAALWQGGADLFITTLMVAALMTPVAWLAGVGRGYLLPLGMALVFVLLANVLAVAGWGHYFPWAVPALYAGAAGDPGAALEPISYWIVLLTCLVGLAGTVLWWRTADQSY